MTNEQLKIANEIAFQKRQIRQELSIWEELIKDVQRLGYREDASMDYARRLESSVPDVIFQGFRQSAISALKQKLADLDEQFKAL